MLSMTCKRGHPMSYRWWGWDCLHCGLKQKQMHHPSKEVEALSLTEQVEALTKGQQHLTEQVEAKSYQH